VHDHDQRFKSLIKEFFAEFLELFFADWARRLDCSQVEWLDKELFPEPPDGDRSVLDLVAKVRAREPIPGYVADAEQAYLALVHIEIESPDKVAAFRPRMFEYYTALRARHGLPVLPIAIYLKVAKDGIGVDSYEEHFWELRPIRFEYLYVGLPGLDAVEYLQRDNWLGWALASLMKIPPDRVVWLGAEALRRITEAPLSDQKRFYLGECVDAYLPLDEKQMREFEALLLTAKNAGVQAMNKTTFEKGIEKGILQERRDAVRELLEEKFGQLPPVADKKLHELSAEDLRQLRKVIPRAASLRELKLDQ
jgi:hypothetical protein